MIDLKLDPPEDEKRDRGQKQPDADFAHGSDGENPVDRRIKPVIEQRNHREDEESVYDVDLLRQKTEAEEMQVHMLALEVHSPPLLWSQSAQKIIVKAKMIQTRARTLIPSLLVRSRKKPSPAGGMCTIFLRPIQKMTVAINISTPGKPKAYLGPQFGSRSRIGQSQIEKDEPRLMEK